MDDTVEWLRETLPSLAEATAFADGLTWDGGGTWEVDAIEPCQSQPGQWDVVFARTDEVEAFSER